MSVEFTKQAKESLSGEDRVGRAFTGWRRAWTGRLERYVACIQWACLELRASDGECLASRSLSTPSAQPCSALRLGSESDATAWRCPVAVE